MAGARVAAVKDGEIRAVAADRRLGRVILPLPAHTAGSLLVTVTGPDLLPYQGAVTLGTVDAFASAEEPDHRRCASAATPTAWPTPARRCR